MALSQPGASAAWRAWAGLLGGAAAWALHHQVLSDVLHFDCRWGGPLATAAVTVLSLGLLAAAAWTSWRSRGRSAALDFVVSLSLLGAALFALLVLVQAIAGMVVPSCPP
jgi:hypothetical protein